MDREIKVYNLKQDKSFNGIILRNTLQVFLRPFSFWWFVLRSASSDGAVVLLRSADEYAEWAADLCDDNVLNVFDLCLMKRKLINGSAIY